MRVRADGNCIEGDWQRVRIADHESFSPAGISSPEKSENVGGSCTLTSVRTGGLLREIETDDRFLRFRLARGMEVILNDEIGALLHEPRETVGQEVRLRADRPAPQGVRRRHLAAYR